MQKTSNTSIIFLMGPTATGKTEIAIKLAEQGPYEIINVDSALIYKHMDIGTGKPLQSTLQQVVHHLVNIIEPDQSYSVHQFCVDAAQLISEIQARGKIPLLVGGTMLYFYTLKHGLSTLPSKNETIRNTLEEERKMLGLEALHQQLQHIDPVLAKKIHPNDPQRLLRALEIYRQTQQAPSAHFAKTEYFLENQSIIEIAFTVNDRALLHQRIAQRFLEMLEQGMIEEVQKLINLPNIHPDLPSMRCVGYRQIWQYLKKEISYEDMIERSIIATRQLAKRQITWLQRFPDAFKINFTHPEKLKEVKEYLLRQIG